MSWLRLTAPRLVVALGLALGVVACSNSWESEAVAARVVDASTGAPVAGAIVMVNWQLKGNEGYPAGQAAIFEQVTDAEGRFRTPAWGPVKTAYLARLDGNQPVVHVFKRGYAPLTIGNFVGAPGQDSSRAEQLIRPHVNGQDLRLQPFAGSLSEYSEQLNQFWLPLTLLVVNSCDWPAAPRLFRALSEMKEEFLRADITSDLWFERNLCKKGAAQP